MGRRTTYEPGTFSWVELETSAADRSAVFYTGLFGWVRPGRAGAERVDDVGCLCMNELIAPDLDAAMGFYGALFGWTTDASEVAAGGPMMVLNGGRVNAAAFGAPDGVAAHWRPCFTVGETAAAADRIRRLGPARPAPARRPGWLAPPAWQAKPTSPTR